MACLVPSTPCLHNVSYMPALMIDLRIITHSFKVLELRRISSSRRARSSTGGQIVGRNRL